MPDEARQRELEDLLHEYHKATLSRLQEHVAWHIRHGSTADRRRLFEIAAKQEAEKLDHMADRYDEDGQENVAELIRTLKDEYLPALVRELKYGA